MEIVELDSSIIVILVDKAEKVSKIEDSKMCEMWGWARFFRSIYWFTYLFIYLLFPSFFLPFLSPFFPSLFSCFLPSFLHSSSLWLKLPSRPSTLYSVLFFWQPFPGSIQMEVIQQNLRIHYRENKLMYFFSLPSVGGQNPFVWSWVTSFEKWRSFLKVNH